MLNNIIYKKKIALEVKISFAFAIIFIITAFFSDGWYFVDEQWQIIEFMSYKLGITKSTDLTWEFHDKIRPWLQPGIYYLLSKISFTADPFINARIFRIFGTLLFLFTFFYLFYSIKKFYSERLFFFLFLATGLFWAVPYFAIRTSSENFSQIFSLLAFTICLNSFGQNKNSSSKLQNNIETKEQACKILNINQLFQNKYYNKWLIILSGLIWGLAFEFRYQTILIFIGSSGWFLLNAKEKFKFLLYIASGFILTILLCLFVDYWGYSVFTFAPYNYFYQNIILKKANSFGTSPFFGYIFEPLTQALMYVYIIYIIAFFKHWKNIFIFTVLPFYLIHILIAHKEGRFLIPALVFTLIPSIQFLYNFYSNNIQFREINFNKFFKYPLYIICISNFIIIIYNIFPPTRVINLEKYLYYNNIKNSEIYTYGNFYKLPRYYDSNTYINYKDNFTDKKENKFYYIIFSQTFNEKSKKIDDFTNKNCKFLFSDFPFSELTFNKYSVLKLPLKHSSNKRIFKCTNT